MKITLEAFANWQTEQEVVVHSIDMAGYQAMVIIDSCEHLLVGGDGRPLRHRSLMQMREALSSMPVASVVLRHQSAYDEMINQPVRKGSNTLELPLSRDLYPYPGRA